VESLFRGHVTWDRCADDRCADDRMGVFHPAQIGVLRTHFEDLLKITSRRLRQHDGGEELGPLDCRIAAIGVRRDRGHDVSELETVLAIANRATHALEALPATGGVVHLRGPDSCFLFGSAALDMWLEQIGWLNEDVVVPLCPVPLPG
jgi:hypothetical protein